jgi:phosphoribosylformylglycinamidine synthase
MQQTVTYLIQSNVLESCHDLADGGLWSALCESSFVNQFGFEIVSNKEIRKDAFLFGEAQGRVLVSTKDEKSLESICNQMQVPFEKIGMVKADAAIIDQENFGRIHDLKKLYDHAIESKM